MSDSVLRDEAGYVNIKFQEGNPHKIGINGATMQEVTQLLLNRLYMFQSSEMQDEYTAHVIEQLESVLDILNHRMIDRLNRGIFGEKIP